MNIATLPETNMAPSNRPEPKSRQPRQTCQEAIKNATFEWRGWALMSSLTVNRITHQRMYQLRKSHPP